MSTPDSSFKDPYPSDPGIVFDADARLWLWAGGRIVDGPERRQQLEELMPTYKPAPHPLHNVRPGA